MFVQGSEILHDMQRKESLETEVLDMLEVVMEYVLGRRQPNITGVDKVERIGANSDHTLQILRRVQNSHVGNLIYFEKFLKLPSQESPL